MSKIITKKFISWWCLGTIIFSLTAWISVAYVLFHFNFLANVKFKDYLAFKFSLIAILVGFSLGIIFGLIYLFKIWERNYENQAKLGYAKISNKKDISKYSSSIFGLIHSNNGFALNLQWNKKLVLKQNIVFNLLHNHHLLVIGSSGVGKSQSIVMWNILINLFAKEISNLIVADPKGELYENIKKYIVKSDYECKILDFNNFKGDGWNPLKPLFDLYIVNNKHIFTDEIEIFANCLISDMANETHNYWKFVAKELIILNIYILFERKNYCLNQYIEQISFNWENQKILFFNLLEDMKAKTNLNTEWKLKAISNLYNTYFNMESEPKNFVDMHSSSKMAVRCLDNQRFLDLAMSKNLINLNNIKQTNKRLIYFIKTNPNNKNNWKLTTIFLSSLITILQNKTTTKKSYFILDEFANIPQLPNFSEIISTARGYNIYFMLICQSYNQLTKIYHKDWNNILGNINYNLYLHSNDVQTNKMFAENLGNKEIRILNHAYHNGKQNKQLQKQKMPLISYDDLPKLAIKNKAILSIKKQAVYEIDLIYFYEYKNKIDEILDKNNLNKI